MQACQINAAQTALQEQDYSLDNEALQSVLSDLEGSGSINTSSDVCNSVDVSQTACSYVKSSQCCSNILNSRKQNVLNLECAHGKIDEINQAQDTADVQQCALTNSQKSEERQAEATTNETSISCGHSKTSIENVSCNYSNSMLNSLRSNWVFLPIISQTTCSSPTNDVSWSINKFIFEY